MPRYAYDLEADGLLDTVRVVHCLVLKDLDTGQRFTFGPDAIQAGVAMLEDADLIVGHNVIQYDNPVLSRIYGFKPRGVVRDTIVLSRLIYPKDDLKARDFRLVEKGQLPSKLIGRYSLEAWGFRLGNYKGDFKGPWDHWSQEMQDYCEQDVEVTFDLWHRLMAKGWPEGPIDLEHRVQEIVFRQEQHGFLFDQEKAAKLYAVLIQRQMDLIAELREVFPARWRKDGKVFTPARDNKKLGYVKDAPLQKIVLTEFDPGNRFHIVEWLKAMRGWEPTEFTEKGEPKCDETIIGALPWPEAKKLSEYLMVAKRLGQLATGKEAWLKHVGPDGRVHGQVTTLGAVTRRMTHQKPNMAQVPGLKDKKTGQPMPYGRECRELFTVAKRKKLVGCDADALELRCLAGYMARYDGGAYVRTILEGRKEDGTDMHSVNARALGCSRDTAKTWFYAFIYGAGDEKLGLILGFKPGQQARKAGRASRLRFLKNLPALGTIVKKVQEAIKKRGYLKAIDGGRLKIRSDHSALNTLLQSAGAILMKRALVILDDDLQAAGYVPGVNYEFVANVHDEWQIEVDEDIADDVGQRAAEAIRAAGRYYDFGCPLDGNYEIGLTWADTH